MPFPGTMQGFAQKDLFPRDLIMLAILRGGGGGGKEGGRLITWGRAPLYQDDGSKGKWGAGVAGGANENYA